MSREGAGAGEVSIPTRDRLALGTVMRGKVTSVPDSFNNEKGPPVKAKVSIETSVPRCLAPA